mmetsp:Transcript_22664/g.40566  ORF Transcript_22664/g.40566 Transcript_22664/m.40566 type:complete len:134 (-) Transcript_22664:311-712(-)
MMKYLLLFPLLLLLVKDTASSPMKNNRALRRYREVRDLNDIVLGSSSSKQRQRRNGTYKLNGRKYFVKKEIHHNNGNINKKHAMQKKEQRNEARQAKDVAKKQLFKYHREPVFLDATKRQAFKNFHRNGLHPR